MRPNATPECLTSTATDTLSTDTNTASSLRASKTCNKGSEGVNRQIDTPG